jgi:RNA polymerase sigma-70 factor (ECF subfamily)
MVRPTTVKPQRSTQRKGGAHVKVENDFLHEEPTGLGKDATNRRRTCDGDLPGRAANGRQSRRRAEFMTSHTETLQAAVDGNDEALAGLIRTYHDRVYRFGLRACRDPFDTEDAVQQAFLKLARRPDVQIAPSALAWLFTTVKHACRRILRGFARQRARLGERTDMPDALASRELSPEAALERFELVERVHAAVAAVPTGCREVLILRDIDGLSGEDVSKALGISEAAMKSRLHRARSMVRERLGGSRT